MSDDRLRELERAWRATPHDREAVAALIAARRRAGLELEPALLAAELHPPRSFASSQRFEVFVHDAEGRVRALGETGRGRPPVELPTHRAWWVRPHAGSRGRALWGELRERRLPGLSLERLRPGGQEWRWLGELGHLRWLSLADVRLTERLVQEVGKLRELSQLCLRRSVVGSPLTGLEDAWAPTLARLPKLTQLDLAGSQALTRAGVAAFTTGASPLSVLDLSACPALDDRGLQGLRGSAELRRLSLGRNRRLGVRALLELQDLPALSELDLVGVAPLDRGARRAFERLPLTRLALGAISEHESPTAFVGGLPASRLRALRLEGTLDAALGVEAVQRFEALESLTIEGQGVGKALFRRAGASEEPHPALRELDVEELSFLSLGELAAAFPRLERLRIAGGNVWAEELELLEPLSLRELSLELQRPESGARSRAGPLPELPPRSEAERAEILARLRGLPPYRPGPRFPGATCFG